VDFVVHSGKKQVPEFIDCTGEWGYSVVDSDVRFLGEFELVVLIPVDFILVDSAIICNILDSVSCVDYVEEIVIYVKTQVNWPLESGDEGVAGIPVSLINRPDLSVILSAMSERCRQNPIELVI
jgi:hypothetical protein